MQNNSAKHMQEKASSQNANAAQLKWYKQPKPQISTGRTCLLLALLGLGLGLGLSSCNSYLADGMRVAWAKQLFQQGNYQEALLHSLDAEHNRRLQNADQSQTLALRRIQYNIGLIYGALGQSQAAIEHWQGILDRGDLDGDETLQFAILYNIGLLYSQIGKNQEARRNLVQALKMRPEHEATRIALELCLKRLKQEQPKEQVLPAPNPDLEEALPSQENIRDQQILDYISRQANYHFKRDTKPLEVRRNDW